MRLKLRSGALLSCAESDGELPEHFLMCAITQRLSQTTPVRNRTTPALSLSRWTRARWVAERCPGFTGCVQLRSRSQRTYPCPSETWEHFVFVTPRPRHGHPHHFFSATCRGASQRSTCPISIFSHARPTHSRVQLEGLRGQLSRRWPLPHLHKGWRCARLQGVHD